MKAFLIALLFPVLAQAQVPASWLHADTKGRALEVADSTLLQERIGRILNFNQELLNEAKLRQSQGFHLARFDAEVGVSISGSIGLLGLGKSSAIEFIWEKQEQNSSENIVINVTDPELAAKEMKDHILGCLTRVQMSDKKRQRIIKRIEKMTLESSKIMEAMLHMPLVGQWQTDSLFHDFFFSASGDLLETVSASYDTRLRFRF